MRKCSAPKNNETPKAATSEVSNLPVNYEKTDMTSLAIADRTINVPFYGNSLFVVEHNGEAYTPMKPIVEGMGLDWKSQHKKISQRFYKGMVEITIPSVGGIQSMICLALRKLAAWLNSISPNKVRPEIRDNVIRYQEECDDVLYEYWTKGEVKKPSKKETTTDERTPLRGLVNRIMGKTGVHYQPIYKMIHREFGVKHIDELTSKQVAEALEYLAGKVLEGELMPRENISAPIAKQFSDDELCSLAWLWRASDIMLTACESVTPLLKVAEHRQAGRFHTIGQELPRTINKARALISRETAHIEFHPWKDDNWSRVLPHLRQEMLQ